MVRLRPMIVLVLLSACGAPQPPSTATPTASTTAPTAIPSATPTDLEQYLAALERIHPEPFHGVDRDEFVAAMREIDARMDERTPQQTMVEVMRLAAMLSRTDGRDGHQLAVAIDGNPMLPIRVFEFADGVFIADAFDPVLIGSRITAVAGHPVDEVLDLLEPLIPRDSPATVPGLRPFFLLNADVLAGLGLIEDPGWVELTLGGDTPRTVTLESIDSASHLAWAGEYGLIHLPQRDGVPFTDRSRLFWTETMDPSTLYVRLTDVEAVPSSDLDALRASLADPALGRVILDLRHNPGGNNYTYSGLLASLQDADLPLWVLIDRRTFSAAGNLAAELEGSTDARFAGEAMGGGLNFWSDVTVVRLTGLPIPMQIGVSTRYWEKSVADDPRLTIEPELEIPYRSADYFAGRDATLEAVLAAP